MRFIVGWLFLAVVVAWIFASSNSWFLWLHVHWPPHRQRMKRAELCLEAGKHWGYAPSMSWPFYAQAYALCEQCGCPADLWPVGVVKIHAGTFHV